MEKRNLVFALINTMSGEHLVIQRLEENKYGLPGGKVAAGELPIAAITREVFEETGLRFDSADFNLLNIQVRTDGEFEDTVYGYGCNKLISEVSPIFTVEKHIKPMFMEPSMFYQLTSFKDYYSNLLGADEQ